jgi:hypothetical protein
MFITFKRENNYFFDLNNLRIRIAFNIKTLNFLKTEGIKMRKFYNAVVFFFFLIALFLFLSSCATLLKNKSDDVSFSSDPAGSEVYANGKLLGTTPVKLRLKTDSTYTIEFKKEGHDTKTFLLGNHISGGWIVLDIVCGVIPLAVDAITGDWYSLDQENVNVILDKQLLNNP